MLLKPMKLNLGCADTVVPGWINVDYAIGARIARLPVLGFLVRRTRLFNLDWSSDIFIHDLSKVFPWSNESVKYIYCSHTFEHFSREHGRRLLSECYRVLKPGGIVRIVVPDLAYQVRRYLSNELPAEKFVEELGVLYGLGGSPLKKALSPFLQFPHKCMYDNHALQRVVRSAGFEVAARAPFDSDIDDIECIELRRRTENAVIIEGIK